MKFIYIFLMGVILMSLSNGAVAHDLKDTDANIVGHVVDKNTKEHLPYVVVTLGGNYFGYGYRPNGTLFPEKSSAGLVYAESGDDRIQAGEPGSDVGKGQYA